MSRSNSTGDGKRSTSRARLVELTRGLADLGRALVVAVRTRQLTFLAAAIAYYAFVSMVPLAVLGLALASFLGGAALARSVLVAVEGVVTPETADLLETALRGGAGRGGATVVGLLVLAWSGLRALRAMDVAFSRIYGVDEREPLAEQVVDAVIVLGTVVPATVVAVGAVAVVPFEVVPYGGTIGAFVAVLVLPVAFLPLYYVFPDRPTTVRVALPGALLAGLGWSVLAWLFGLYASVAGGFALYGLLGVVFLVLTWFYAASLLVLLGATLNAVLAGHAGDRQIQLTAARRAGHRETMSDGASTDEHDGERRPDGGDERRADGSGVGGSVETRRVRPEEIVELRREIEAVAEDLEEKTVAREDLESDLRRYVRWRQRRGHARGWGPYLVLLYGTIMTLGAFYYLSSGYAVLAMLVIWLSTLGLYALMLIVGWLASTVGLTGQVVERVRELR